MGAVKREHVDPATGRPLSNANAAVRLLERPTRRMLFKHLVRYPGSSKKDLVVDTGITPATVVQALNDLITLGYVHADDEHPRHGVPQRFTADREGFLSDLAELQRDFPPAPVESRER